MSLNLFIRDVEGERQLDAEHLPIRVGTGSDCELRLPGPGAAPVMMLDVLDDVPFVQPVGRDESMAINGEPLWAIIAMSACFHGIQALEQFVLAPKLLGDAVELRADGGVEILGSLQCPYYVHTALVRALA